MNKQIHFSRLSGTVLSLCLLSFSACAGSLNRDQLEATTADLPKAFSLPSDGDSDGKQTSGDAAWWLQCNDPALNQHIETALHNAPDMQAAWARLEQAAAAAGIAKAALMPSLNASADPQKTYRKGPNGGSIAPNAYDIRLVASFELDIWGRNASRSKAAQRDAIASREDTETLAISLSAQVADTWWRLCAQHDVVKNIGQQVELQNSICELYQVQQGSGVRSAADVASQKQTRSLLRAQHAQAQSNQEIFCLRLNLLCGRASDTKIEMSTQVPQLSVAPTLGIPASVLNQRPDVRAALNRVYAADQRTAAAKGDRLPQLTLGLSAGLQNNTTFTFFENWFTRLSASLLAPIFDGGRLKAEQRRNEAVVRERLAIYRSAVLSAITEIEEALHQERAAIISLSQARIHEDLAAQRLADIKLRYRNASVDLARVLQERLTHLRSQRSLIDSNRDRRLQRIALHRALGGRWTTALSDSAESDESDESAESIDSSSVKKHPHNLPEVSP